MFDAELETPWRPPHLVVGFAGCGGQSKAIRRFFLRDPTMAMNHWQVAVLTHQALFPATEHHCADIGELDARAWRPGERVGFAWFSPDCTEFSKAKGSAPKSERIRGLIWSTTPWAMFRRPDVMMFENVEEFEQAGPVYRCPDDWRAKGVRGEVGQPIKALRGQTFQRWVTRMRRIGGQVEWRTLKCSDYGARTIRKRLYIIVRFDGRPIVWPPATHAPRHKAAAAGLPPWRGAHECIDFSRRCPSVFLTQDEAKAEGLRVRRPLVKATLGRVARGVERYVIDTADPFLIAITQRTWGEDRAHDMREPIRTLTSSKGGEFALVAASLHQANTRDVGSDAHDPLRTGTGHAHQGLVAAYLGRQFGSTVSGRALHDPHPTAMTEGGGGKSQLIAAHLGSYYGAVADVGSDLGESMRTATGKDRHALTAAWLEQANTGMVGHSAFNPLSTMVGKGCTQRLVQARLALEGGEVGRRSQVLAFLWEHFGEPTEAEWADPLATREGRLKFGLVVIDGQAWMIVDIGLRMLTARELGLSMGLDDDMSVDAWGRSVSGVHQTQMIGNAVNPDVAHALIAANCDHLLPPELRAAA